MRGVAVSKILLPLLLVALLATGIVYINAQKQVQSNTTTTGALNTTTQTNTATGTSAPKSSSSNHNSNCVCICVEKQGKEFRELKQLMKHIAKEEEDEEEHEELGHGYHWWGKLPAVLNVTELTGTVVSKSNRTLVAVLNVNNTNYTLVFSNVYVRASDGVLVSGAYVFKSVNVGDTVTIKTLALALNTTHAPVLEISVGGVVYDSPLYYKYLVLTSG